MKSTVYPRHWLRLCCNFCSIKPFRKRQTPQGWVVATAGNPPQFNRSVREFDIVTMDRLKVLEVEADYETWRNYGVNKGIRVNGEYLDIKKQDFYVIEEILWMENPMSRPVVGSVRDALSV